MKKKTKNSRPFTLLEIALCMAILGITAAFLGWHIKNMVFMHTFHKHMEHLHTDLHKFQILALTNRIDIEVKIKKEKDRFFYSVHCDQPLKEIRPKPYPLKGVVKLIVEKKETKNLDLHIFPSGRIEPTAQIGFFHKEEEDTNFGLLLDLSTPLQIKLRPL